MKCHFFILIGFTFLSSCNEQKTDYFQNESRIVEEKISYNLEKLEIKYMLNPKLATPYYEIARYLKTSFDSISVYVDQENEIKFQNKLEELHNRILTDSYFDSRYINDIILPNRIRKWIDNTEKLNYVNNSSILKLDLLNLENEILSYVYNSIEADYYKFNKLQAMVVDSSDNVKVGETYHANIFINAHNTTRSPLIMVADYSQPDSILLLDQPDNKRLFAVDVIDGRGIYKKKITNPGKHGYKGVICFPNAKGELEKIMFYKEFKASR